MMGLFLCLCCCGARAEDEAVRYEADPSLRFLLRLREIMEDVSDPYRKDQEAYRKRMEEIWKKARNLSARIADPSQKGRDHALDEQRARESARALANEALVETEAYLARMAQHLKENRSRIADVLLEEAPRAEKSAK